MKAEDVIVQLKARVAHYKTRISLLRLRGTEDDMLLSDSLEDLKIRAEQKIYELNLACSM